MQILPDWLKNGYLRLFEPIADLLVRHRVHPNVVTVFGTICTVAGGVLYGTGHISVGGWLLAITAFTDVLDGMVARRGNTASIYGAFLDSTLDRLADGAVLGGLAVFFAMSPGHHSVPMVVCCIAALVGAFLTSYTRARAEALGLDAKVGMLQREERVVLLSAPQALFGLMFNGWVLTGIIILLTVTAWITVFQRMHYVFMKTRAAAPADNESDAETYRRWTPRPAPRETAARPALKGE